MVRMGYQSIYRKKRHGGSIWVKGLEFFDAAV
jgi:hypothetical protein